MNSMRWIGSLLFVLALVCLVATGKPSLYGQEKKTEEKKTEEKKTEEKKAEEKKAEEKKAEEKKAEEKKTEEKKGEEKKGEEKKVEAKGDGWMFKAFDPKSPAFYQEVKTVTKQKMTVMTQTVDQTQDQTFILMWTPKEKVGSNYVVTQKIVGVKMNIDIGGNKIAYDSTKIKDQPKNPMTDFFNQLLNQELTFTISADKLEVVEIKGRDEFIKALGDTNPQMTSLLKTILSEDSLKKMAEPTWWALPTSAVTKGATWNKTSTLNLGPIGTYKTTFDFAYAGPEGKLEKINITKADMKYSAPTDKAGLPFTIKDAKLESKDGTGEALFDPTKGRFDSTKISMKLNGTLSIDVGNMVTEITLDQDQNSTSKSYDANPWGDTKK